MGYAQLSPSFGQEGELCSRERNLRHRVLSKDALLLGYVAKGLYLDGQHFSEGSNG